MTRSPLLVVILDRDAGGASVLRDVKAVTGAGLTEVRSRIIAGLPVVVEEMFTNAWFDERAARLVSLLTDWEERGVGFRIWESTAEPDSGPDRLTADAGELSLEVLRNIVAADGAGEER